MSKKRRAEKDARATPARTARVDVADDGVVLPDDDDYGAWIEEDKERARAEASEGVEMGRHICGSCLMPTLVDDLSSCRGCGLVLCPMCVPIRASCKHVTNAIFCEACVNCAECNPDVEAQRAAQRAQTIVCISAKCKGQISSLLFAERGWHLCWVCGFAICESCIRICKHVYPLCKECECVSCRNGH